MGLPKMNSSGCVGWWVNVSFAPAWSIRSFEGGQSLANLRLAALLGADIESQFAQCEEDDNYVIEVKENYKWRPKHAKKF